MAWEEMPGTDRVRSCEQCQQQVFDLSQLTRAEAEALIDAHAGKVCVRYYQRADGTILLADCTYHEARGGWLPAIAVAAAFGIGVVATPPEAPPEEVTATMGLPESAARDDLQRVPVVVVSADGAMTYRGELVATVEHVLRHGRPIDALAERLASSLPTGARPPWDRAVIIHAHGSTDARVINAIAASIEGAGLYPVFGMKSD